MTTIAAFALAGVITYLLRCSMVLFGNRLASSTVAESTIRLITPAVLTAIVASALLLQHGEIARPDLPGMLAVAAAVVAVRRTSNVGLALAVGLPTYWVGSLAMTVSGFA
jgi:branched-subunit amino acid transport protein